MEKLELEMGKNVIRGKDGIFVVIKEQDDCASNPRSENDGLIGTMVCWSHRYNLGDDHSYEKPASFLRDMVRKYIEPDELRKALKAKELNCRLKYDRSRKEYALMVPCYYSTPVGASEPEYSVDSYWSKEEVESSDWFIDGLVESLSMNCMRELLQNRPTFVMLPLYLYDHSGITMSVYSFNDRWDSGQCGWIYTDAQRAMELWSTDALDEGWKNRAIEELTDEVNTYDSWLRNDVYGVAIYEWLGNEDDPSDTPENHLGQNGIDDADFFEEQESCWGFYGTSDDANGLEDFVRSEIRL